MNQTIALIGDTDALRNADPILAALISTSKTGVLEQLEFTPPDHYYGALVRSIVGQQLSTKAASAINARLLTKFDGLPPTPAQILEQEPEQLRSEVGLSRAKVGFLRSLAEHVLDGSLELERLPALEDDEVIAELTRVKGIGVWTAHMFLMFHLCRPDVLPVSDLGIRRAMMIAYQLDALPAPEQMVEIAAAWQPHRTLACRYLWRSLDNEPG